MKNTVITTAEITVIEEEFKSFDEQRIAKYLKTELCADDVVVTKVQVFEGTDSAKE